MTEARLYPDRPLCTEDWSQIRQTVTLCQRTKCIPSEELWMCLQRELQRKRFKTYLENDEKI